MASAATQKVVCLTVIIPHGQTEQPQNSGRPSTTQGSACAAARTTAGWPSAPTQSTADAHARR